MHNKIIIIDTSVLCCWLEVPGKETCGPTNDRWTNKRVMNFIQNETMSGATLVLPLATIIETGNHIAQSNTLRFECAQKLVELIRFTANKESPWAAFSEQSTLWEPEALLRLVDEWPTLASQEISIGDATIKNVAEHYAKNALWEVEILTGDAGLKAYQPAAPKRIPRRNKR